MWSRKSGRRQQVQELLTETIRTLCKNTLADEGDVTVEGLLGITVNSEVILVNINELVECKNQQPDSSGELPSADDSSQLRPSNRKRSHDQSESRGFDVVASTSKFFDKPPSPRPIYSFNEPKSRRPSSPNSNWTLNEVAPSVDLSSTPGVIGENEKEVLVVSPIDEEESQEAIKTEGRTSIAVLHYPAFPEVTVSDQQDEENAAAKETLAKDNENDWDSDEDNKLFNKIFDDSLDNRDFNTAQSITSDSTVTSDPARVEGAPSRDGTNTKDGSTTPFTYACSFCSKNFKCKSNLKKHCFDKHNIQHLYKCPYCEQYVVNRRQFKEHVQTHEENRPFKCGICGRMFQTQADLKHHLVTPNVHRNSLPRLMQQ